MPPYEHTGEVVATHVHQWYFNEAYFIVYFDSKKYVVRCAVQQAHQHYVNKSCI